MTEACPEHNPCCDGTVLLHGDWCKEPRCDYCGDLGWTVRKYGRITHKEACPHRTDPWSQTYPQRTEDGLDVPRNTDVSWFRAQRTEEAPDSWAGPVPPEDVERAAEYVKQRGWVQRTEEADDAS